MSAASIQFMLFAGQGKMQYNIDPNIIHVNTNRKKTCMMVMVMKCFPLVCQTKMSIAPYTVISLVISVSGTIRFASDLTGPSMNNLAESRFTIQEHFPGAAFKTHHVWLSFNFFTDWPAKWPNFWHHRVFSKCGAETRPM